MSSNIAYRRGDERHVETLYMGELLRPVVLDPPGCRCGELRLQILEAYQEAVCTASELGKMEDPRTPEFLEMCAAYSIAMCRALLLNDVRLALVLRAYKSRR